MFTVNKFNFEDLLIYFFKSTKLQTPLQAFGRFCLYLSIFDILEIDVIDIDSLEFDEIGSCAID